jgi:EAL domain-containing protein (putative c-di-GMP-specific phosphodiesterase class I)
MGSTNGTFVEGSRIQGPHELANGTLIQFADVAFRVTRQMQRATQTVGSDLCDTALALSQFDRLMSEDGAVVAHYQPIVDANSSETLGYEVLGRSRIYGLKKPDAMFRAASQLQLGAELSRMFRKVGIESTAGYESQPHLFLNTYPEELDDIRSLISSLKSLRDLNATQPMTIEIHESTVANSQTMSLLRVALEDLQMGLAYDDFGAGQSRLVELANVPPDYLKFDMTLVREIHKATPQKQEMMGKLVKMTKDLGAVALAEGIENEEEAAVCRQLGFQLFQGFHFGRPGKASAYLRLAQNAC